MSLSERIMVFVISLVLLLGALTIGIYSYFVDKSMTTLQQNWSSLVSQSIAESTANYVVNNNVLQLKKILKPIVSVNKDIEYAYIVDFENNIIAYTYEEKNLSLFKQFIKEDNDKLYKELVFNDKDIIDFSYPIVEGLPAKVHIGVNDTSIIKIESALIKNILIVYAIVGALSILMGRFIGNRIVDPVSRLIKQMNKFGRSGSSRKLTVSSGDKLIQDLVTTFNNMVEKRIRDEQELRASEESTRLLLNHIGEAVHGIDIDGNCTFANPACVKMLGYDSSSELIGKNMHQLIHHHREDGSDYPQEECCILKAHQEGSNVHKSEEVFWRKDGSNFSVEYWSDLLYRHGEITGSVVSFIDITERKETGVRPGKKSTEPGRGPTNFRYR